jgi:uncharacterized protein YacL
VLVEVVRLLIVLVATAGGYRVGQAIDPVGSALAIGTAVGAGIGYVGGGVLGRIAFASLNRAEQQLRKISAAKVLVGGLSALIGAVISALGLIPVAVLLPTIVGWPIFGVGVWLFTGVLGVLGASRAEGVLSRLGMVTVPGSGGDATFASGASIADPSALLDGRLLSLARVGFLRGPLLVPRFVLDDLASLAEATDPVRRRKGRRGLELLESLSRERLVNLVVTEDEMHSFETTAAKLVALARRHGATLITMDGPLQKAAELQGVRCVHLGHLADGLRQVHLPGEVLELSISKAGRDPGQGVGFLDDGTMVVVGDADELMGHDVTVKVTGNVRTSQGRMLFASLASER